MLPAELASKIDDLMKADLQNWSDWWFHFLDVSTRLVVIGIAFEGPEILHAVVYVLRHWWSVIVNWWEMKRRLTDFCGWDEVCPEINVVMRRSEVHPPNLVKVMGLIGWILVVLGVAGEMIADSKLADANSNLRAFNDKLVTEAREEAGNAKASADSAAIAASSAANEAGKAQQKAGAVAKQADELNRRLLAAKTQLDAVDAKRAELETSLVNLAVCNAPRIIPLWSIGNQETSVDPIKPFARQAIIEFVFDAETRRAAFSIAGTLEKAGWKISRLAPVDGIADGVEIQPFMAPFDVKTEDWYSLLQAQTSSTEAADAVVDFLHSYNWEAKRGWPIDEKGVMIHDPRIIPPDSLRIRVGLYPAVTYANPPGAKDFAAVLAQDEQERETLRKQMEAEQLKRDEEEHLTPEQAIKFKALREQWDEEAKVRRKRYSSPCKPLTPNPFVR